MRDNSDSDQCDGEGAIKMYLRSGKQNHQCGKMNLVVYMSHYPEKSKFLKHFKSHKLLIFELYSSMVHEVIYRTGREMLLKS